MLKFLILLSAVVCALAGTVSVKHIQELEGRIVGGENTTIESYPYAVSIDFLGDFNCAGSIISKDFILSAAHCFVYKIESWYKVRAGSTYLYKDGVELGIKEIIIHENYNFLNFESDISLLKLETPVKFGHSMQPIPLPIEDAQDGAPVYVVGWGDEEAGAKKPTKVLNVAFLYLISSDRCKSPEYKYGSKIGPNMFCASDEGKDTCQGDSGGPLASEGILLGVVSWGSGCAEIDKPGVYTNVKTYVPWIKSKIAKK